MADSKYLVTNNPLESKLFTDGFKNDITPLDDHNLNTLIDGITKVNANILDRHQDLDNRKVEKDGNKGLSTNDFTTALKTKLVGIQEGAEVNVQSDWAETDTNKDSYIKNKPTINSAYSATSDNAQSGKAVAQAVAPKADKTYVDSNFEQKFDVLIIDGGNAQDAINGSW